MNTLLLLFALFSKHYAAPPAPLADSTVYICDSSTAKRYHLNKSCKGLSTCQHKIRKMTLEQAREKGRTLCGLEKPKS